MLIKKREKSLYTKEKFIEKANIIHNNKYDYSKVNYINSHTKILIICKKHGEFLQYPSEHLAGKGCLKCGIENAHENAKLPFKTFIKRATSIYGNQYIYYENTYDGFNKKTKIFCKKCKKIFTKKVSKFLAGQGCPFCNNAISSGENQIIVWLNNNNIQYEFQKKFKDCKDKSTLRFDFYLPEHNICIEFQGKQHYQKGTIFDKTENDFKERQKRDQIKRNYCKKHNIKLIEIKYTENIQNTLQKILQVKCQASE